MSNNKFGLQSGRPIVLLRCDSCYEPLSGSQKFYQYFLCLSHSMKCWVNGSFSVFLLKVSSCIYKRTGYGETLKAFHRSDIRHTCIRKCAMVTQADCDSWGDIFSLTAPREVDLLKLYVSRYSDTFFFLASIPPIIIEWNVIFLKSFEALQSSERPGFLLNDLHIMQSNK